MSDHRYRYRLPDGQVFESTNLARIKRQHPDAFIEGRIEFNERGEGTLVRYQGEQPTEDEPADQPADASDEQNAPSGEGPYEGKTYTELKELAEQRDLKPGTSRESALATLLEADAAATQSA